MLTVHIYEPTKIRHDQSTLIDKPEGPYIPDISHNCVGVVTPLAVPRTEVII